MSKLVNAIEAYNTQNRISLPMPHLCEVNEEVINRQKIGMADEYKISVTLQTRAFIANHTELAPAVKACKRAIVHDVFGEFKDYFLRIEQALWERDFDAAQTLLNQFERQMFSIDED